MMPDLQRLIAAVAQRYCDTTTPHLQFDDLMSEGNVKLAELITKGMLENDKKCPSRVKFFKFFKAAAANHARSRVQKYRFTEKRTGQKPPPRAQRKFTPGQTETDEDEHATPEYHKNVELSLDDPDAGIQVPDAVDHSQSGEINEINWGFSDEAAEWAMLLTPVERLVFHEMILPSTHALCHAQLDAWRKPSQRKISIKIKETHMAEAVGLSPELFHEAVLSIRSKIEAYRMLNDAQQESAAHRSAIVAQLKQVFGLQIPPDLDEMVVNRMLTMAAREQFDKVAGNTQVAEMLTEIGAKVPRSIGGGKLACYGVLYQRNCRQCNSCDLRHSCAVEAANLGMTKMVQSPRLLGARQPRIPAFLPRTDTAVTHVTTEDEAEIVNQLQETFQQAERNGLTYYYHHVGDEKKRRYIFCVERTAPLRLRFCNPSESLKKRLVGKQKTWFPRENASLSEIIALIEQHGRETFEA